MTPTAKAVEVNKYKPLGIIATKLLVSETTLAVVSISNLPCVQKARKIKAAIVITVIPITKNKRFNDFNISEGERLNLLALAWMELATQSTPTLLALTKALPLVTNVPE